MVARPSPAQGLLSGPDVVFLVCLDRLLISSSPFHLSKSVHGTGASVSNTRDLFAEETKEFVSTFETYIFSPQTREGGTHYPCDCCLFSGSLPRHPLNISFFYCSASPFPF